MSYTNIASTTLNNSTISSNTIQSNNTPIPIPAPIILQLIAPNTESLDDYISSRSSTPYIPRAVSTISSPYRPASPNHFRFSPTLDLLRQIDEQRSSQNILSPRPVKNYTTIQYLRQSIDTWLNHQQPAPPRESTPYPPAILERPAHTSYSPSNESAQSPPTVATTPDNRTTTPVEDPWANQPEDDENGWPTSIEDLHAEQAKLNWDEAWQHERRHGVCMYDLDYHRARRLAAKPYKENLDRYLRVSDRDNCFERLQKDVYDYNPNAAKDIINYREMAKTKHRITKQLEKLRRKMIDIRHQENECRRHLNRAGIPYYLKSRAPVEPHMLRTESEEEEMNQEPEDEDPYWY